MDFDCTNCKHLENMIHSKVCPNCFKGDRWEPIPKTNADRIRAMTDEELAEWIISITEDDTPGWLNWLKQEAE